MSAVKLARKRIPLSGSGEFLLLDYDGSELRGAHYFRRPPPGVPGSQEPAPPQQVYDALIAEGVFKPGSKREAWCRVAVARDALADLLYVLLQDSRHDWTTIEGYIRSTDWGADLP